MSVKLRIIILLVSVATVIWILYKIRRLKVKMEDTIFWIFFAGIMSILGLFPQIAYELAGLIGIVSPVNFVFFLMIIILFEKVFTLSVLVSQMEEKITILSSEIALRSHEKDEMIKKSLGAGNKEEQDRHGGKHNGPEMDLISEKEEADT